LISLYVKTASPLSLTAGYSNYFGVKTVIKDTEKVVTNTSSNGGWFMISGVELGKQSLSAVEVIVSSEANGKLEIWLDDLKNGKLIATIRVSATEGENKWKALSKSVSKAAGRHDVFIKFPTGKEGTIFIKSLRFIK
jgi:xylan 1,4-beta-xylosidase